MLLSFALFFLFSGFGLSVTIRREVASPDFEPVSTIEIPPDDRVTIIKGVSSDYISGASSNNANQTDPSKLIGIPESGQAAFAVSLERQERIQDVQSSNSTRYQGYVHLIRDSLVGTCGVPNVNYDNYFGYLSADFPTGTHSAGLCEPEYCIRILYNGTFVVVKANGTGIVPNFDLQIGLKAFSVLSTSNAVVLPVTWQIVRCSEFPLGPWSEPGDTLSISSFTAQDPLSPPSFEQQQQQQIVTVETTPMVGGYGAVKEADASISALFTQQIISQMEQMLGMPIKQVRPITYQQQVVAGTNYKIRAEVTDSADNTFLVDVVIFQPLPVNGAVPQLVSAQLVNV